MAAARSRRKKSSKLSPAGLAAVFAVAVAGFAILIWWLAGRAPEDTRRDMDGFADRIVQLAIEHGADRSEVVQDDPIRKVDGVFVRTWRVTLPGLDAVEGFVTDLATEADLRGTRLEPVERGPDDAARVRVELGAEAFDLHLWTAPARVAVASPDATPEPTPAPTPTVRPTLPPDARGRLAIVLDDAGQSMELVPRAAALASEVAVAVLPFLPHSSETAAVFHRSGHEIWLHLPMEANGGENPGPGAVTVDMDSGDVRMAIHSALNSVPHAVGVNNHMGSRATADLRTMTWVMQELSVLDVAFLDSRTTVGTVAEDAARSQGVPTGRRHVFLDNDRNRAAIEAQLDEAVYTARATGEAVAIGHLNRATIEVLEDHLPALEGRGVDLVPPSQLMR